jgi:hypothetical protein
VKAANLNLAAAQAGYDYAATLTKLDPYFTIEAMDKTPGRSSSTATPPRRWAHVRRRHGGHVVSHHAVVLAARR